MQKSAVTQRMRPLFYSKAKTLRFVMRVSSFLFMLIVLTANLLRGEDGLGQGLADKTISLELHNETLRNALNKIEELSGYRMAYVLQEVTGYNNINLEKGKRTVKKTLELILGNTHLAFKQDELTILIYNRGRRSVELVMSDSVDAYTLAANADTTVRGRVTTAEGEALEGVTVLVKGTNISTATNAQGYFFLKGVQRNIVLLFSFIGFERQEVRVDGNRNVEVKLMKRGGTVLDEVVVSTGYQKISRERFVGSVSTVDSALFHREVSTNLMSRLDGILPGTLFLKNRSSDAIQIRGISSIESEEVLIILDNFPFTGNINNINPNDVENITVLRDAAAASIWGARAGNGVIIITTKSGNYNQPLRMTYTSSLNLKEKPNLFYYPQMNSSEFIDLEEFLFAQGKYDGDFTSLSYPVISPVVTILKKQRDGLMSEGEARAQIDALGSLDVRNDYEKYVFRNVINQQHYLNFNGGTNQIRYTLSAGYDNNPSEYQGEGYYKRYSITSNTTFKPYKFLELSAGINFSKGINRNGAVSYPLSVGGGGKSLIYPYAQLADALGNHLAIPYQRSIHFADTVDTEGLLDWHYRPLDELQFAGITKSQFYNINIGANLNFTSWLNGSLQYQYMQEGSVYTNIQGMGSYYTRNLINTFYNPNGTTLALRYPVAMGVILDLTENENITQNLRGQLNFNKNFGGRHSVTALIASEVGQTSLKTNSNRTYGYDDSKLTFAANTDYNTSFPTYFGSERNIESGIFFGEKSDRRVGLLANVSYTYNSKYSLYASARKDGANIFGTATNNKWKPLWSVGGSWDISKEGFYKIKWLPYLKLRSSYGYTGNNPRALAVPILGNLNTSVYTGTPLGSILGLPNPDLRWEKVGIINFGTDFRFGKNRISGSVDIFQKKSTDVIAYFPIDPTIGYIGRGNVARNAANLKASGFDILLHTINTSGRFQWQTTFNLSYAKSVITKYFDNFIMTPSIDVGINAGAGHLAYGLYSYKWAGLDPLTGDPQGYLDGKISKEYNKIFLDSFQHQVFNGSSSPLYFGNMLNVFFFKGFTLSFNISLKLGYYFRRPTINYEGLINGWQGNADYSKRWQKPGDERLTTIPSLVYPFSSETEGRDAFYARSEINVEKGDHIRLQDIRLSYSWANKNLRRFPVETVQFFVYPGNLNLLLWKKTKSGFDPDYTGGVGGVSLPPSRTWAAGMTVNFK